MMITDLTQASGLRHTHLMSEEFTCIGLLYTYLTDESGVPATYTFKGKSSAHPYADFDFDALPLWITAIEQMLEHGQTHDPQLMRESKQHQFFIELKDKEDDCLFSVLKVPVVIGKREFMFTLLRDITPMMRKSMISGSRNALFKIVAENVPDVFCVIDARGNLVFLSPSFTQLTGYKTNEFTPKLLISALSADSYSRLKKLWNNFQELIAGNDFDGEIIPQHTEVELKCRDGSMCWVEIISAPFVIAPGRFEGIHAIIRDITERRTSQEAI
ncbi:MAG: PAS domain S-box protein, partial [Lentimicrobiaceae bacterium]|nr:PAS domain S-box protein [Lentimicrobiaceae bacterium]